MRKTAPPGMLWGQDFQAERTAVQGPWVVGVTLPCGRSCTQVSGCGSDGGGAEARGGGGCAGSGGLRRPLQDSAEKDRRSLFAFWGPGVQVLLWVGGWVVGGHLLGNGGSTRVPARRGWAFDWAGCPWTGVGGHGGRECEVQRRLSSPVPRPPLLPFSVLGLLHDTTAGAVSSRKEGADPEGDLSHRPQGHLKISWGSQPAACIRQSTGRVTAFPCPVFAATGSELGSAPMTGESPGLQKFPESLGR